MKPTKQDEEGVDEIPSCLPTDIATEPSPMIQSRLRVIGPRNPTLISSNNLPHSRRAAAFLSSVEAAPQNFNMEVNSASKYVCLAAIAKELKSMEYLKLWDVLELSPTFKLFRTTWVFKVRKAHLGKVVEHKVRLFAQGFTQTAGVDLEKTYSPTG
ncbi:hypothetical protein O181_065806 [Austropuccinia psidii MF-1]|uniref:Reverse transcriptase Ty1/copia-type domain-containing protein n=1 Tax=Austropuccinia psidii MF-1 TaxID=1389203 RepID=A0A9Q3I1J5_9BASI|nr:hypothetical protein [Austropuccinia psidii MF-1]